MCKNTQQTGQVKSAGLCEEGESGTPLIDYEKKGVFGMPLEVVEYFGE